MSLLRSELRTRILRELAVQSSIDPGSEITRRVDFLKAYLRSTPATGFVLGISGGQDSTLTGALCQRAAAELRSEGAEAEFLAVRLPYGVQADEADAAISLEFIRARSDGDRQHQGRCRRLGGSDAEALGTGEVRDFVRGNIKARQRMVAQYALAGELGYVVVGTDHAAEAITGFFTKFGDGGVDITPLTGLTKRQGAALLRELRAPESTWKKVPTARSGGRPPGSSRRGSPRRHLHRDRRLPRRQGRRRRGGRETRTHVPRHTPQAAQFPSLRSTNGGQPRTERQPPANGGRTSTLSPSVVLGSRVRSSPTRNADTRRTSTTASPCRSSTAAFNAPRSQPSGRSNISLEQPDASAAPANT